MVFDHAVSSYDPLGSHKLGHTPWCLGCRRLLSAPPWDNPSDVGLQATDYKALSRGIIGKSAPILAEIAVRKSQSGVSSGCSNEM